MAKIDELKKIAKEALDTIADVSVETYRLAEEKAKVLAKKAKLNTEIARERALIRRAKQNIGGVYYELHRDAPQEEMKLFCDQIAASIELIAANQRELEELKKAGSPYTDADVEACGCEDAEVEAEEAEACSCSREGDE